MTNLNDTDMFRVTNPKFNMMRGRGMTLTLLFLKDMCVLVMASKCGHRVEVRGHKGVGTDYQGDRLDRVLDAVPRRMVNLSDLFADRTVGVPKGLVDPLLDALEFEDMLVDRLMKGN